MKKILLFLSLAIFAFQAQAKSWLNYAGLSLNVPVISTSIENANSDIKEQDVFELGGGGGLSYIGVHNSGFLVKADAFLGAITSSDVKIQGNGRNVGFLENIAAGAGYAIVNTQEILFGAAVMGGVEIAQYSDDYKRESANIKHQYTDSIWFVTGSVGGDIFVVYNLGPHFGFLLQAGVRYIYAGAGQSEQKDEWTEDAVNKSASTSSDFDLSGKFVISPSIGVIWHF